MYMIDILSWESWELWESKIVERETNEMNLIYSSTIQFLFNQHRCQYEFGQILRFWILPAVTLIVTLHH